MPTMPSMKYGGRSSSGKDPEAGADQGKEVVAAEPLEEPDSGAPRGTQPPIPDEPAGIQGLSAEGKPGAAMEVHVPRSHAQLPAEVDGSTAVAAAEAGRGTRRHAIEALGRHRQLLPDQSHDGGGGSR